MDTTLVIDNTCLTVTDSLLNTTVVIQGNQQPKEFKVDIGDNLKCVSLWIIGVIGICCFFKYILQFSKQELVVKEKETTDSQVESDINKRREYDLKIKLIDKMKDINKNDIQDIISELNKINLNE